GNSSGQAAVFLSQSTKHVYILIRGSGLADTMSKYLIRRIEETPNITLLTHTELVELEGSEHLQRVTWRNNQTSKTENKSIAHVFVMTGADPNTDWLDGCVALDGKGFIKTGPDLMKPDRKSTRLNSSHVAISYAVFCLKKKKKTTKEYKFN